jgi:hypothetical protein
MDGWRAAGRRQNEANPPVSERRGNARADIGSCRRRDARVVVFVVVVVSRSLTRGDGRLLI